MSESKTPRTDEIAQRHLAGCDIVTCYHYAIRLANYLETELAAVKAERDMWKANHDNQVKLKSAIMDRPDLGDRARKVTALSEQLAASHAREAQLREALRLMAEANPGVAVMPTIEAKKQNLAQRLALQALTLPPPPVVPLYVAEKLVDALVCECHGSRHKCDACNARKEYEAWRAAR